MYGIFRKLFLIPLMKLNYLVTGKIFVANKWSSLISLSHWTVIIDETIHIIFQALRAAACKSSTRCRSCSATWTTCATTPAVTTTRIGCRRPSQCRWPWRPSTARSWLDSFPGSTIHCLSIRTDQLNKTRWRGGWTGVVFWTEISRG